jgi:hypothetical protein
MAPSTTQVISQAVECPENICIQMAKRPAFSGGQAQPQAYCTAKCNSDSDCEGGENCWREDPNDANARTRLPYRCVKPIVISTEEGQEDSGAGGLFCEGLCICEADARVQDNPVVMRPSEDCREENEQLCQDWDVVDPPQCE